MADEGKGNWKKRDNRPQISAQELFDRQPPYALEAEMCLLGSLILEPKIIPEALPFVRGSKDFYDDKHGHIYQAIIDLYDQRNTGDLVQLIDLLRDRKVLDLCGGVDYLETLANSVPAATNAPHFARIVGEKAKLRRLIDTAGQIIYDAYHTGELGPEGAREVLDKAEMAVFEIAQESASTDPQSLAELLELELQRIEKADFEGGGYSGVATGYYDLDEMLRGFQPGEFIIIAARPSMGKCLTADSEIVCRDGSVVTIEELVRSQRGEISTLRDDKKLDWMKPSAFINDGMKPAFEVVTRLGRRICTTLTHPFLTVSGWQPLGALQVGTHIAVPRVLHAFGTQPMDDCRVKLLAYLIGDGGLTGSTPRFTNSNPRIAADFAACVQAFGGLRLELSSSREGEAPSWRIARDEQTTAAAREQFAVALRQALHRANLTQEAAARAVNVSKAAMHQWVHAVAMPT
ncbi:MAG TPA: DnaB-like helicase N-terminal domain-containing protein, partial [Phycisphaerales bacterium]|nr:DnaB-like helicase N-terminal domain-containing protein [Phycisphaerales bacterium]